MAAGVGRPSWRRVAVLACRLATLDLGAGRRRDRQTDRRRDPCMGRSPMVDGPVDDGHRCGAASAGSRRGETRSSRTRCQTDGGSAMPGGVSGMRLATSPVAHARTFREPARRHADDLGRSSSPRAAAGGGARLARRPPSRCPGPRARSHCPGRLAGAPRGAARVCRVLVPPVVLDR
jgi:hypothetical protein